MSTVTVLLCTYNGEKYIVEQLTSLLQQSMKINTVIIKDDCSTDKTVDIVNEYIALYNLSNWHLIVNEKNIGWKKNFVSMLKYISTDYFFFCDQDDIWELNKIEEMVRIMDENDSIEVLVSKYHLFGENSNKILKKQSTSNLVYEVKQKNFLLHNYPGCVMCLRSCATISLYEKYWTEEMPHDTFATLIGLAHRALYLYDKILIQYRRHPLTATHSTIMSQKERINVCQYYLRLIDVFTALAGSDNEKKIAVVTEWTINRLYAMKYKQPRYLLKNIKYLSLYWSFKTYIMDWLCCMGLY